MILYLNTQPVKGNIKTVVMAGLLVAFGLSFIAINQLTQPDPESLKLKNLESKIDSGYSLTALEQKEYCKLLAKIRKIFLPNCEKLNLQNGRIISNTSNKESCVKRNYLFPDRNKALNWARLQLGHDTKKTYTSDGQLNGWEKENGDSVYWNHGDWIVGIDKSKYPHINFNIGNCKGHLYLKDKIINAGLWEEFKERFNL